MESAKAFEPEFPVGIIDWVVAAAGVKYSDKVDAMIAGFLPGVPPGLRKLGLGWVIRQYVAPRTHPAVGAFGGGLVLAGIAEFLPSLEPRAFAPNQTAHVHTHAHAPAQPLSVEAELGKIARQIAATSVASVGGGR